MLSTISPYLSERWSDRVTPPAETRLRLDFEAQRPASRPWWLRLHDMGNFPFVSCVFFKSGLEYCLGIMIVKKNSTKHNNQDWNTGISWEIHGDCMIKR